MRVGMILGKLASNKTENTQNRDVNSGSNFSKALLEIGKNITHFIPKISSGMKASEATLKKVKAAEVKDELPKLEDEVEKLLSKIERVLEKQDNKKNKK